jgi:hypothetical protein
MRLSHITVISWLFYAGLTFAADVRLGPETAVTRDSSDVQPAPFDQTTARVASNGRDFLAVWLDGRDGRSEYYDKAIYLSRLDSEGRPFVPGGRKFADRGYATIASNGVDYLIVWNDLQGTTYTQRVDRDGNAIGEQRVLPYKVFPAILASNGSTYLVIGEAVGFFRFQVLLLDRDGEVLHHEIFSGYLEIGSLSVRDGKYQLFSDEGDSLRLVTVGDSGGIEERVIVRSGKFSGYDPVLAAGDRTSLVAWNEWEDYRPRFAIFDEQGILSIPTLLDVPPHTNAVRAAWDGNEFLLVLMSQASLYADRISRHGILLTETPYVLSSTPGLNIPTLAWNGTTWMLVWSDTRFGHGNDVVARAFRNFSELAASPGGVRLVTMSGRAQLGMQLAVGGSHRMAVWTDDANRTIEGILDGTEVSIAQPGKRLSLPSIAAGDDSFLVAWSDGRLLARRFAFNGAPLDVAPLVLLDDVSVDERPGVVFDGTSFVVAAGSRDVVHVAQVDPHTAAITRSSYRQDGLPEVLRVQPLSAERFAFTCRKLAGNMLYASEPKSFGLRLVNSSFDTRFPFDVSAAPDHLTFAYERLHEISLLRTGSDGFWIGTPYSIRREGLIGDVAIAWNGAELVVVWTEDDITKTMQSLLAMRFDAELHPLDDTPIVVAEQVAMFSKPVAVATPDGVLIGYSRIDENNRNAPRAFTRTLFR